MIVVSDSSPIIVLSKLNSLEILHDLFNQVFIPSSVQHEIQDLYSNETSSWLIVQDPQSIVNYQGLHTGETAAIALAKELYADYLIMDEKLGRTVAKQASVKVIGTVGVLEIAADAGLLDLATAFDTLKQTNFRIKPQFLDVRLQAFERRQQLKRDSE